MPTSERPPALATISAGTRYLTDGVHLYEITRNDKVRNAGLTGGEYQVVCVQDAADDKSGPRRLGTIELALMTEVS